MRAFVSGLVLAAGASPRLGQPKQSSSSYRTGIGALDPRADAVTMVRAVAVDRPHPRDVNTWEEYERLLRGPA